MKTILKRNILIPLMTFLATIPIIMMVYARQTDDIDRKEYSRTLTEPFKDYWFSGTAEISSYDIEQARYGKTHEGQAVAIFVTEPFSRSEHVKLDNPKSAEEDKVTVMKLNLVKKFTTGVYPYSMMMSSFTPVKGQPGSMLKLTTSSQEWCGHTFMQLNKTGQNYNADLRSYFESEGDKDKVVLTHLTEDELWTQIRLDPENLPTGKHEILPSSFYLRLMHKPMVPVTANLSINKNVANPIGKSKRNQYVIEFPEHERIVKIVYEQEFPHKIIGWEEEYISGFPGVGDGPQRLKTTATLRKTIRSDYWNKNQPKHTDLRNSLGL